MAEYVLREHGRASVARRPELTPEGDAMKKPIRPQRSWEDLGREDAKKGEYRPPTNSDRARQVYQFGWEEAADDAAWATRMRG